MKVVITGVGRRLGFELAQHFLTQGHQVIGTYRQSYPEIATLDSMGAELYPLELTDRTAVQQFADDIAHKHPSIDVLIHNASAFSPTPDDRTQALTDFDTFSSVHIQVPFILNETLRDNLANSTYQHGNIIHLTDIYVQKPSPKFRLYCASKAALQSLNDSYAISLAPKIRVNAILPGPLAFLPEHSEAAKKQVLAATPLQTLGGFSPVIQTVDYIINNPYLTGASIRVDGGRSLAM
ncbi:SDR family oxidoreductase [Salinispirillum marinum]|uniref:Dihydromonapterin reductase n=2 Tax=Saccharospirillaceae TaxID=255527 RepID=A0ABV8BFN1_9GAMM